MAILLKKMKTFGNFLTVKWEFSGGSVTDKHSFLLPYSGYWDEEDDYDDGAGYDGFFGFGIGSGQREGGPGAGGTWDKKRRRGSYESSMFSLNTALKKGMTFWQWLLYQARRAARAVARGARAITGSQPDDRRRRR